MSDEYELGDLSDLRDGELRGFPDVGDKGVVVCRVDGDLYALDNQCSHARVPLDGGRLRGATLTCPLHGAQFDVRTGAHSGPPAFIGVPCHQVDENDGGAVVHIVARVELPPDPTSGAFRTR